MATNDNEYISALKFDLLTPFYDFLIRHTIRENTFKQKLVQEVGLKAGQKALDLGCGTATLSILLKQEYPDSEISGIDGDAKILQIAQNKIKKVGETIALQQGLVYNLPYLNNSFNKVISSLVFHHLTIDDKVQTLKEIFRILRPSGELYIADWGKPKNFFLRVAFLSIQLLDGFTTTKDNVQGLLPPLIRAVGFERVEEICQYATAFGSISLYKAVKSPILD